MITRMLMSILAFRLKIAFVLAFALVSCVQPSRSVSGQAADKSQSNQVRTVERQVLTSTYLPPIRIRIDSRFKYVGTQKFILYERAQAEQFFFVDADTNGQIKGMYLVQFEGYLPAVDATYNYSSTETVTLGGQTYIVNAESVSNVSAAIKQNPESDTARATAFLQSKGYRIGESIRFQRFVRLVDEAKRNELLLIYVEDASASSGQATIGKEFLARAIAGFTILNSHK